MIALCPHLRTVDGVAIKVVSLLGVLACLLDCQGEARLLLFNEAGELRVHIPPHDVFVCKLKLLQDGQHSL